MAPVGQADQQVIESQLKNVIQDLYEIMIQISNYDTAGKPSKEVLENQIKTLQHSLSLVHTTTTNPTSLPNIPPELIQYVDNGRNPDIYTREFVELARKGNQLMKGKMEAWGGFRDVLAAEMGRCLPELEGDVKLVVEGTGGDVTKIEGLGGGVKGEE